MWKYASLVGGTLVIVGSFLTWVSVDVGFATFSATGFENIEGKLTAAAGAVLVVLVVLAIVEMGPVKVLNVLALVAAGIRRSRSAIGVPRCARAHPRCRQQR